MFQIRPQKLDERDRPEVPSHFGKCNISFKIHVEVRRETSLIIPSSQKELIPVTTIKPTLVRKNTPRQGLKRSVYRSNLQTCYKIYVHHWRSETLLGFVGYISVYGGSPRT